MVLYFIGVCAHSWNIFQHFNTVRPCSILYLSFQFQMNKYEKKLCKFEMHLKNFFVCILI